MAARKPTTKNEPAKNVAIDVMRKGRRTSPRQGDLSKRLLESGRYTGLKGKTPDATTAAMLAVGE